ncbi:thyroid receptor-interacting protein 11-like isoform X1 [Cimex lectularius]|uniref:GRIP domain-containing protein n=2 Tax=Cimex lectularius TaxID=79782 RepID=A0A8I6S4U8_CIMLE|nr:thyroid receptor-interacting protein 11-like isoform X1 [Cimex lectularius]
MAWFEGISSSLKGQISNLAKGVLADDSDTEKSQGNATSLTPSNSSNEPRAGTSDGWSSEQLVTDTFIGQIRTESPRSNEGHSQSNPQPQEEEEPSLISKKLASFLSLGKGSDSEEQIAALQEENRTLRLDNESKAHEIRTCTRIIRELESLVAVGQDENSNLSTGMEELDIQHQQAIEQVLSVKEETHKQLEALQKAYAELEESHRSLSEEKSDNNRNEENNIHAEEITRLQEENRLLHTELEEAKRKADQNEILIRELEERDRELEELEGVNMTLRSDIDILREAHNDSETNRSSLPPIPENNEIEALEHRIASLEMETSILREVRSNLETEVSNSSLRIEELNQRLQISEGTNRNQENLQIEIEKANEVQLKLKKEGELKNSYIRDLENELERAKKDNDELKKLISEKDKDKELSWYENHSKEESLLQDNATLKKKLSQMELQAKEVDKELERLQKENEVKQNKMCELMFEMNSVSEDLKKSLKKESDLKLQIKELELKLDSSKDIEQEVTQERSKMIELNEEMVKLQNENSRLQEELHSKSLEITLLKECADAERSNFTSEKALLLKEIESHKNDELHILKEIQNQKSMEYKKQLELKEEELHKLKISIEEREFNWNEQLTSTVSDLEMKIAQRDAELHRLQRVDLDRSNVEENINSELEVLKHSLDMTKQEYEAFKLKSNKKETLIREELAKKYEEHEKEIVEKLEKRIEQQDQQLAALLQSYNDVKFQFESLQEKLGTVEKNLNGQINDNKELLKQIQIKEVVASGLASEMDQIKLTLKQECNNGENLKKQIAQLTSQKTDIENQLKEKEAFLEQINAAKSKEITTLKQEVESLKNQLEYATQLMHVAERQEAEGRGVTPPPQKNTCSSECQETQEELNQITTALLKEQTENKRLLNQVNELKDANTKVNTQLSRLQTHLMEMENYYTSLEISSSKKIAELEAKQAKVDDWVKSSSTAYTSANIRANQQVEALTKQVKLLTEHKEKMEAELSRAEDDAQKQLAAVTNLQAVLHQFQQDKQRDIDFETDRIKQKLNLAYMTNNELLAQIKDLQDQLSETKKGLVAATRLSEQLDQKEEQIGTLKSEVAGLQKKLNSAEDKLKNINSTFEAKIDRNLMKNLLVGYISSGTQYKEQVLRVISQVLELSKEERQRVGLDSEENSNGPQQSLSEAFIKFLETESQPKPQIFLPLSQPPSLNPSRKSSQSSPAGSIHPEEAHLNLPHFPVGRNAGSILKDVLKDRNT